MADFSEFLAHIHKLEENVVLPVSGQGALDFSGKDFDKDMFGTLTPGGGAGFDASQFTTTYDTTMFATLTNQAMHAPNMQGAADMDSFLQCLSPQSVKELARFDTHRLRSFPFSPGQPVALFKDEVPEPIPQVKFDNLQAIALDPRSGATVNQILASNVFTDGMRIIVKPGVITSPIVLNRPCVLKADGEVSIEVDGAAITVDQDVEVSIEGFAITKGDIVAASGTLQLAKCSVATTLFARGASSVACREVSFVNNTNCSLQLDDFCKATLIECSTTGKGVLLNRGTISMLRCKVESVIGSAVKAYGGNGSFENCQFRDCTENVIDVAGNCDLIFSKCKVEDTEGGHLFNVKNGAVCKMKSCELSGRCKLAILASNSASVLCDDIKNLKKPVVSVTNAVVRMRACTPQSVFADCGRIAMHECQVDAAPTTGVVGVGTADIFIRDSQFRNCGDNGVEVSGDATCTLIRCTFKQNRKAGVLLNSVNSTLRNCVFDDNSLVGCQVSGKDVSAVFEDCSFVENLIAGVSVLDGARPKFSKSQFRANKKFGAVVSGARPTFDGCDFSVNASVGLDLKGGATPALELCVFDSNRGFACQVSGDGTTAHFSQCTFQKNTSKSAVIVYDKAISGFTGCTFTENGVCHAEIREGGRARFDQCQLSDSHGGVAVFGHDDSVVEVEGCTIENERKTGVYCTGPSQTRINNSEITGCGSCGVLFEGSASAAILNSKLTSNGNAGVQVEGGEVHIDSCEIGRHTFYGIFARTGASVTEEKNVYSGNERGDVQTGS